MIQTRRIAVAPQQMMKVTVVATFIRAMSATHPFEVQTNPAPETNGNSSKFSMEAGLGFETDKFASVNVRNPHKTETLVLELTFSDEGVVTDNRLVGRLDLVGAIDTRKQMPKRRSVTKYRVEPTNKDLVGEDKNLYYTPKSKSRHIQIYNPYNGSIRVRDQHGHNPAAGMGNWLETAGSIEWDTLQPFMVTGVNSEHVPFTIYIIEDYDV